MTSTSEMIRFKACTQTANASRNCFELKALLNCKHRFLDRSTKAVTNAKQSVSVPMSFALTAEHVHHIQSTCAHPDYQIGGTRAIVADLDLLLTSLGTDRHE